MNAVASDQRPRPALLHIAVSTFVIAISALTAYRNLTAYNASLVPAILSIGLVVMQTRSTFARSPKEARICTWLLLLLTIVNSVGAMTHLVQISSQSWNTSSAVKLLRNILIALLFGLATYISFRWSRQLNAFNVQPRLIRRYSLAEMAVILSSLCLVAALFADTFRPRPNYDEWNEALLSHDQDLAAQQKRDTESLAALLGPIVPNGWSLTIRKREVIIQRAQPIEAYNAISLPDGFSSKAEEQAYIRSHRAFLVKFTVVLWLDKKLTSGEHAQIGQQNGEARRKAYEDNAKVGKFSPNRRFWLQHPEYGYRRLPSFATDEQSVYMKINPSGHRSWGYLSPSDEEECEALLDAVRKRFPTDYNCRECAD